MISEELSVLRRYRLFWFAEQKAVCCTFASGLTVQKEKDSCKSSALTAYMMSFSCVAYKC